jgi:hypothetical protein
MTTTFEYVQFIRNANISLIGNASNPRILGRFSFGILEELAELEQKIADYNTPGSGVTTDDLMLETGDVFAFSTLVLLCHSWGVPANQHSNTEVFYNNIATYATSILQASIDLPPLAVDMDTCAKNAAAVAKEFRKMYVIGTPFRPKLIADTLPLARAILIGASMTVYSFSELFDANIDKLSARISTGTLTVGSERPNE